MKIKFKLIKFEKCLAFQILEQDEQKNRVDIEIDKNLIVIVSSAHPALAIDYDEYNGNYGLRIHIYLRGRRSDLNKQVALVYFTSNEIRDKTHDLIIKAFKNASEENKI
jgi:hypothetical protein